MLANKLAEHYYRIQKRKEESQARPLREADSMTSVARSGLAWIEALLVRERGLDIDGMTYIARQQFETVMFRLRPLLDRAQLSVEEVCEAGIGAGLFTGMALAFQIADERRYVVCRDDNPDSDNPDPPPGWDGKVWLVQDTTDATYMGDYYTRDDALKHAKELNAPA